MNPSKQPVSMSLASLFILASLLVSATAFGQGSFVTYGSGCPGSVSAVCASNNGNTTQKLTYVQNSFTHGLQVPASAKATLVDGFELWTRSATNSPVTVTTTLFGVSGGKPSKVLATSKMTIGTTDGWYRTTFASPVAIPANTVYFLSYSGGTNVMYFPILTSGTNATFFTWYQGLWYGPYSNSPWAWRVNCRQVPQIGCTGVPTIGKTHTLTLSNAKPNEQAFLAIGITRLNTPFPGAPSCFLLTDVYALLPLKTDEKGSIQFPERVPNKPKLKGLTITQQFAVVDPVNAAQLVFSAGGEIRL